MHCWHRSGRIFHPRNLHKTGAQEYHGLRCRYLRSTATFLLQMSLRLAYDTLPKKITLSISGDSLINCLEDLKSPCRCLPFYLSSGVSTVITGARRDKCLSTWYRKAITYWGFPLFLSSPTCLQQIIKALCMTRAKLTKSVLYVNMSPLAMSGVNDLKYILSI